jgi:hypothetical protein
MQEVCISTSKQAQGNQEAQVEGPWKKGMRTVFEARGIEEGDE